MIVKAWFIVAVMSGVYTDGTKDIFIAHGRGVKVSVINRMLKYKYVFRSI